MSALRLVLGVSCMFLAGCGTIKPQRGGSAAVYMPIDQNGMEQEWALANLTQPENPNTPSNQESSFSRTVEKIYPTETTVKTVTKSKDGSVTEVTEVIPAGTKLIESTQHGVKQEVGSSWQDTAREISAKLGSFKGVQFLGAGFLLLAAAGFHPVVRATIGGGKQFQMALGGIGVLLIFGPSLLVGQEKILIIGAIIVGALVYLLSRLSHKEGKEDAIKTNESGKP